jgi:hypothetical protein
MQRQPKTPDKQLAAALELSFIDIPELGEGAFGVAASELVGMRHGTRYGAPTHPVSRILPPPRSL